jgi:hypothetical protein
MDENMSEARALNSFGCWTHALYPNVSGCLQSRNPNCNWPRECCKQVAHDD